ncbi:hypothetical protein ACFLWW_02840 [Chloroflexota bacterium]
MKIRIHEFGIKLAYSFPIILFLYRLWKKLVYTFISVIPVAGAFHRKLIVGDLIRLKEISFLLNSLFLNIEKEKEFLASLPLNILMNYGFLVRKLGELQKEKIKEALDPSRKTVAIYFPSAAYRENVGNIGDELRNKGYNVLTLIGAIAGDEHEKKNHVFYVGSGIIEDVDFVDVFICMTLSSNLPQNSKKVLFVHDIHDSPVGDIDTQLELVFGYDYFFLPSCYVVNRVKQLVTMARDKFSGDIVTNKQACLIPGGYIKLDRNRQYFEKHKQEIKTLIYAPTVTEGQKSLEDVVSVPQYGDKIVEAILNNFTDYDLIFRPHPHTLHTLAVQNIARKYAGHPRFTFDDNGSFYMENYSKSALMITDLSGTAYTYAFTTLRPVVFFSHVEDEVKKRFDGFRYIEDRSRIGYVAQDINEILEKIQLLLTDKDGFSARIQEYRDSLIYNIGKSEDYFVDNFEYIIEDKKHPDWVYL